MLSTAAAMLFLFSVVVSGTPAQSSSDLFVNPVPIPPASKADTAPNAITNGATLTLSGTLENPYGTPCPSCTVTSALLHQMDANGSTLLGGDITVTVVNNGGSLSGTYSGAYEPEASFVMLEVTATDGLGASETGISPVPGVPVDNTPPVIVEARARNLTTIDVSLSEPIGSTGKMPASDWFASDGNTHTVADASISPSSAGGSSVTLTLVAPLESNDAIGTVVYDPLAEETRAFDRVGQALASHEVALRDMLPTAPELSQLGGQAERGDGTFYTDDSTPVLTISNVEVSDTVEVYRDLDGNGKADRLTDELLDSDVAQGSEIELHPALGSAQERISLLTILLDGRGNESPADVSYVALDTADPAPVLGSSTHTPEPAAAGDTVTFSVGWSDPGDSVRALICKTNAVSSGACSGGTWGVGNPSASSPSTTSLQISPSDYGSNTYHAFACDSTNVCSSSIAGAFSIASSPTDEMSVVAHRVPEFGGAYVDEGTSTLNIWLTNPTAPKASLVQAALVDVLGDQTLNDLAPVPLQADYGFLQLQGWHDQVSVAALTSGATMTDVDDRMNRVAIGVTNKVVQSPVVEALLFARGVPREAVLIEETEPAEFALQLVRRPVVGGLQVDYRLGLKCSLGFNAMRRGVRGFVSAAHCSSVQGGLDGRIVGQPTTSQSIGSETVDPPFFGNRVDPACPPAQRCRYGDVNFNAYYGSVPSRQGHIARIPAGTLHWNGVDTHRIVREETALVGRTVFKVGRTTGRNSGVVNRFCANVPVLYTNIVMLCETQAETMIVQDGDSGAPAFRIHPGGDVGISGIVWGEGGWFTSINSLQNSSRELGPLNTCAAGFSC